MIVCCLQDMMKHITGIFDEHGDDARLPRGAGSNMKITGLCTIGKPAVIWNHGPKKDTDSYLQMHLLHGVNFMAPFVDNDHSIHYPVDDSVYAAYGPLFAELRSLHCVLAREKQIGGSGGSLEPTGPLLEPPGPFLTHLHTVIWHVLSAFLSA